MPLCTGDCRSEGILAFFASVCKKKKKVLHLIIVIWKHLPTGKNFSSLKPEQIVQPLFIYWWQVQYLYNWEERERDGSSSCAF